MKKPIQILIIAVLLTLFAPLTCASEAQDDKLKRAVSLMQNAQWKLAYSEFSEIDVAEQAAGVSEGVYGKLLYSMGLCQMELAKIGEAELRVGFYTNALKDFERCRNFTGPADDQNRYITRSLLRMAMCYQAMDRFDDAYTAYGAFLVERKQVVDVYDHGSLLLNLVTCSLRRTTPVDAEILRYLRQAVEGRERFKIAPEPLYGAILDVYAYTASRVSPEQERDLLGWLAECADDLAEGSDIGLESLSQTVQKLLNDGALKNAQSLLETLPWLSAGSSEKSDLSSSNERNAVLLARSIEQYVHTQPVRQRGYLLNQLLEHFPESTRVSEWLYQSIVVSFELDQIDQARAAVSLYQSKFPDGKHRETVELLELSSLFDAGQYLEALELAGANALGAVAQREDRLYVMTGSTCFLGEYERSLKLAAEYLSLSPNGKHVMSVRYFRAVSYARLGYTTQARSILSNITVAELHGYAQYELAVLDFESASYLEAQERLVHVRELELVPQLRVHVDLLSARTAAILRNREAAEVSYKAALELARSSDMLELEQEVMFHLIAFYGREQVAGDPNPDMGKCLPYYDEFFQKFSDSVYAAQVAAAAMPALKNAGELDRGIKRLEQVLQVSCCQLKEAGLRNAANTLIWARIDAGMKPSELKSEFRAHDPSTFALVQWFALAEVYVAGLDQAHLSWGRKLRYDAILRSMYAELSLRSKGVKLPGYIHSALGSWFLVDENFPQLAREHFAVAQHSSLLSQRELAKLGEAKALRLSEELADLEQAKVLLTGLLKRSGGNVMLLEEAMYESIEILSKLKLWDILTDRSKEYLIEKKFDYQRSRVWYLLAKSYDLREMKEDAMANYSRVFAGYTRVLPVSAPSVDRLSVLTWQRNRPETGEEKADRQVAYQLAHRYLSMVKDYPEWEKKRDGVREPLAAIRTNVEAWEASGEVVSVEQMLKEMRQGKR
ncbi:MAG: hypothetical protein ABGY95_01780 [Rubritalea sp.]|uniref:hypothetical protein n=1 Tax=Rubritalea sp. TaxID=2109375 RepID=UPI003242FAAF